MSYPPWSAGPGKEAVVILPSMVCWGLAEATFFSRRIPYATSPLPRFPKAVSVTLTRVEAGTCFWSIAGLRHKVICCCYLEPRPESFCMRVNPWQWPPAQCRWVDFHSFLFQTLALAVECQTWIWEPPVMPPCLCSGTCSPGAVTPLSWLWNVGLVHRPFRAPVLTLLFLISLSGT